MVERNPARLHVALAGVVCALVLGILGMHALATHAGMAGMSGMSGMAEMPATPQSVTSANGDAVGAIATSIWPVAADDAGDQHGGGGGHGAMMWCAVMLATAALILLGLLVLSRAPRLAGGVRRPRAPSEAPARRVVPSGPPHVWAWSVVRC